MSDQIGDGPDREEGATTPRTESSAPPSGSAARTVPLTQRLGQVALVVLAILFLVFAVANAQFVDFNWVLGRTEVTRTAGERVSGGVPLIVLLLGAFVAGATLGTGLNWRRQRRRRGAPPVRRTGRR